MGCGPTGVEDTEHKLRKAQHEFHDAQIALYYTLRRWARFGVVIVGVLLTVYNIPFPRSNIDTTLKHCNEDMTFM